jgi:ketosteroid isomerase-like protein
MALSNLETVRRGYDAFLRGDIDGVLRYLSPEVEAYDDERAITAHVYRGHDGFLRMLAETVEGFDQVRYEVDRFGEVGERVLVDARRFARGAASGVEVEERQFHVWDVHDGMATRFRLFLSREDALRAARER